VAIALVHGFQVILDRWRQRQHLAEEDPGVSISLKIIGGLDEASSQPLPRLSHGLCNYIDIHLWDPFASDPGEPANAAPLPELQDFTIPTYPADWNNTDTLRPAKRSR
jgi:hypothetical protein